MPEMALSANNVVRNSVRCLCYIRAEFMSKAVWRVLFIAGVVGIGSHLAVKIQGRVGLGHKRTINGHLMQVDANTMVLGIAVEEHAELEQRIWRILDAWHHASRRKGGLLDITVEVFRVLVQNEPAEFLHWELVPRPDLGHVKGIESKLVRISLIRLHDLHIGCPLDFLATLDCVPEVSLRIVWISSTHCYGFLISKLFLPVLGNEMVFDVDECTVSIHPFKGVTTITMIKAPTLRCTVVTEEHEASVVGLGRIGKEIEKCIKI